MVKNEDPGILLADVRAALNGDPIRDTSGQGSSTSGFERAPTSGSGPKDYDPSTLPLEFGYDLDVFQKWAAQWVAQPGANVIIEAHTGSGKTSVGMLAVGNALARGQRSYWLNNIKTLCNQCYYKFRRAKWKLPDGGEANGSSVAVMDWSDYSGYGFDDLDAWGDEEDDFSHLNEEIEAMNMGTQGDISANPLIGIQTGDVVRDAKTAKVVVQITEVLANRILTHDPTVWENVGTVVIDEAHMIGDPERGSKYETVVAALRDHPEITLVMLSATLGNTSMIANWVSRVRGGKVYVAGTDNRPVPLYFYVHTGTNLHASLPGSAFAWGPGGSPRLTMKRMKKK